MRVTASSARPQLGEPCEKTRQVIKTPAKRTRASCWDTPATRVSQVKRLDRATLERIAEFVDTRLAGELKVEQLAQIAMLSPYHFSRLFKASTGLSPYQFVIARRMEWAKRLLAESDISVEQVAHSVGWTNVGHFRRVFRYHVGMLPAELRKIDRGKRPAAVR